MLDVFCITDPFDCGEHWEVEGHQSPNHCGPDSDPVLDPITGDISMENLFVGVNVDSRLEVSTGDWLGEAQHVM